MYAGENETKSRQFLTYFLKFLIEWHREHGARLLSKMQDALHRGNRSKMLHKRVCLDSRKAIAHEIC